jgi:AcrR family transcriptional regulator
MAKREDNKLRKRQRILAAARHQFAAHGFAETTIRSIAAEAGVAIGTVLLYAESKHALLNDVWREATVPILEAALEAAEGKALIDGANSLFEPLLRAYALDPALARVVIKELPWLEGRAAEQHAPDLRRLMAALARLVASEREHAPGGEVEPLLGASVLFAIYYASCLELVVPSGTGDIERVLGNLRARVELVARGLGGKT